MRTLIATLALATAVAACSGADRQRRPDDDDVQQSDFHYQLAIGHWQAQEIPVAIRELNTALEHNPYNDDALFLLGFIYQGRLNYAETERLYLRALELDPDRYEVTNNLGTVYLEQGRWHEAEALFHQLTAAPTYATPGHAWNNLGWAVFQQRRYDEARDAFEMAIRFQPEHCLAYNNLGMTYEELGMDRQAAGAYEDAITRCDDYQEPYYRLPLLLIRLDRDLERAFELLETCVELGADTTYGMRCQEYLAPSDW